MGELSFSSVDLRFSDFLSTEVTNIKFFNVSWGRAADGRRYILPIENEKIYGDYILFDDFLKNDENKLKLLGEFYRQMKKKCRDDQNFFEASLWHYSEKEVQLKYLRATNPWTFYRMILEIYKFISCYGEDPYQSFKILWYMLSFLFIILAIGAMQYVGGPPYDVTIERTIKLIHVFFQYVLFMKIDWKPNDLYDVAAMILSRLVIPLQAAIFVFALRNKLQR